MECTPRPLRDSFAWPRLATQSSLQRVSGIIGMAPGCCWHSFPGIPPGSGERTHACLRRVHGRSEGKGDTTQRCVFYLSSTFHLLSILPVCPHPNMKAS